MGIGFGTISNGNINNPIIIDSYGGVGRAIINGENHYSCIYLDNKKGFEISNLELINDSGNFPVFFLHFWNHPNFYNGFYSIFRNHPGFGLILLGFGLVFGLI